MRFDQRRDRHAQLARHPVARRIDLEMLIHGKKRDPAKGIPCRIRQAPGHETGQPMQAIDALGAEQNAGSLRAHTMAAEEAAARHVQPGTSVKGPQFT